MELPVSLPNGKPMWPFVFAFDSRILLLTHEQGKCFLFHMVIEKSKTRFVKGFCVDLLKPENDPYSILKADESTLEVGNEKDHIVMEFNSIVSQQTWMVKNIFRFYHQGQLFGIQIQDGLLWIHRFDNGVLEDKPVKVQKVDSLWKITAAPIVYQKTQLLFVVTISQNKLHLHQLVFLNNDFKITKMTSPFYLRTKKNEHIWSLCFHQDQLLMGCMASDQQKGFLAWVPLLEFFPVAEPLKNLCFT